MKEDPKSKYTFVAIERFLNLSMGALLLTIFIYWSYSALTKYFDEPVATQIEFKFGDDDKGNISFPVLTFCKLDLDYIDEALGCGENSFLLFEKFNECMNSTPDLTIETFLEKIKYDYKDLIFAQLEPMYLQNDEAVKKQDLLWSPVVHPYYGYCYNFDPSKVPGLEKLAISNLYGNPSIYFELMNPEGNYDGINWQIMLHSGHDLPDSYDLYPTIYTFSMFYHVEILILKKVISSVSTKARPCNEFSKQTCFSRKMYEEVTTTYGCAPFFATADYLGIPQNATIKSCDAKTSLEISLKYFTEGSASDLMENCKSKTGCKQTKYYLQESKFVDDNQTTHTDLYIRFGDPIVEFNTDSISYDLQSLVGEVGGTLGLTIGMSGYSFVALFVSGLKWFARVCN